MGKGAGFGKTILIGDQFVLYEVPALVSALPFETVAEVERVEGTGWVLEDNRPEVPGYKEKKKHQQEESINRILKVMKVDAERTPIRINLGGDLLAASGVGASAASCVSLARALNEEFNLGLTIEEINHVGWEGEFAYHGLPSGVDNTASTYGGLLLYQVKGEKKAFERVKPRRPLEIVLCNSGITADTSKLRGVTEKLRKENAGLFSERLEEIRKQARGLKAAIEEGDLREAGKIMSMNHQILISMGLSHEKLISLCDLALENGAFGAKLTGGGMGGYMIALTPGRELQEKVAAVLQREGHGILRATLGSEGGSGAAMGDPISNA
jgi:mevalonate kinase